MNPDRRRRHEAMAVTNAARVDAEQGAGHDFIAQQHDHPVDRPHELHLERAPAHAPRNRQRIECRLHQAWQQLHGSGTFFDSRIMQVLGAVRIVLARERFPGYAATVRESERRARGCACGIESHLARRPAPRDLLIALVQAQAAHQHREPPRRRKRFDGAGFEPEIAQPCGQPIGKRLLERMQCLGRQLFGAELDQKVAALGRARRLRWRRRTHALTGCATWDLSIGKPSASRLA